MKICNYKLWYYISRHIHKWTDLSVIEASMMIALKHSIPKYNFLSHLENNNKPLMKRCLLLHRQKNSAAAKEWTSELTSHCYRTKFSGLTTHTYYWRFTTWRTIEPHTRLCRKTLAIWMKMWVPPLTIKRWLDPLPPSRVLMELMLIQVHSNQSTTCSSSPHPRHQQPMSGRWGQKAPVRILGARSKLRHQLTSSDLTRFPR